MEVTRVEPSIRRMSISRFDQSLQWLDNWLARLLIGLVKTYKLTLSPWIGQQCRFYPTCSSYSVTALRTHGGVRGFWLTIKRLGRCHPFAEGGVDEVPLSSCTTSLKSHQIQKFQRESQQVGEV